MCGISGYQIRLSDVTSFRPESKRLLNHLKHRGPDASGEYHSSDGTLFLGHNRLSIIDLSALGNQPMIDEHGNVLILNGEIYNYKLIRSQLISAGHSFRSESDTEVLLAAFAEWGLDCFAKLKGMYAFAIWSESEKSLYLARDPMGIKPLYYWVIPNGKGIAFASELSAFKTLPGFSKQVDQQSLKQFLEFGYSIDDHRTIFEGVYKLRAGHCSTIKDGQISDTLEFYTPQKIDRGHSLVSESELYETLSDVVKEHLVADVPVGSLLSGGLDSSLLAAIAAKHEKINTFSMGFADSQVDERHFARQVSEFIGSKHHEFLLEPKDIMDDLESVAVHFDDLFADWGMISTRLLYKHCRDQGVKVVLVGEGSDELFGGYPIFRESLSNSRGGGSEMAVVKLYRRYAGRRYGSQYMKFRKQMKRYLASTNNDLFAAIRLFESRSQLPNNYVMKVDKASMSQSVEARTPFLDSRIADLAYRLPKELLIDDHAEKKILKSIARQYKLLPEEIIDRPKYGAGIASNWMDDSSRFRGYAMEIILADNSWVDTLGLRDAMQRYFVHGEKGYKAPRAISVFSNLAWRLLILNLWSRALGVKS